MENLPLPGSITIPKDSKNPLKFHHNQTNSTKLKQPCVTRI